jgi:hypothetical protein
VAVGGPPSDRWEEKPPARAVDRIARLVKDTRDCDFVEHSAEALMVNHLKTVAAVISLLPAGYICSYCWPISARHYRESTPAGNSVASASSHLVGGC